MGNLMGQPIQLWRKGRVTGFISIANLIGKVSALFFEKTVSARTMKVWR
jgi:hypothetical protein